MTDEAGPWRSNPKARGIDIDESLTPNYYEWSNERLIDGYRRNSILLREYGADGRTIQALCAIEECLRARNIDPERIVKKLDA